MHYLTFWILPLAPLLIYARLSRKLKASRSRIIPPKQERVLVVGASSGIGRAIALVYASRGAQVVVVGRREALLEEVRGACQTAGATKALKVTADFCNVEDMVRVRDLVTNELQGLDTLIVAAGVSALQPLVSGVAGATRDPNKLNKFQLGQPTADGIERAKLVANRAVDGNFIGPVVTAVAFVPLLELSSQSPSILLVSSVASVIPAPTRSLYASTKGASLLLYQSLAIEHPQISFSNILPGTVEGDFRASAVDGGEIREDVSGALKVEEVAKTCVKAVDTGEKYVFLPAKFRLAHAVYWVFPALVERFASRKYNYHP